MLYGTICHVGVKFLTVDDTAAAKRLKTLDRQILDDRGEEVAMSPYCNQRQLNCVGHCRWLHIAHSQTVMLLAKRHCFDLN
jgi:hypothetical protein